MSITASDVLIIAPELATARAQAKVPTVPSGNQIVADTVAQLDPAQWSNGNANGSALYDQACKYLAAHRWALTVRGAFGQSGPVVGESVGAVSRQYASPSPMGTDPDLDLTPWGKKYKALRRSALVSRIGIVC